MIPSVLLNALKEFNFVGAPLWRLSDGKDLVRVELTFHKNQPTSRYDKKSAESRRQPAPSAGEWPRQPPAARRPPTTTRSTPASRQPTLEKETSPPAVQTLQTSTPSTIRHQRKPQTAEITPSPIIMWPTIPPPSPDSPPTKKPRIKSPKYTTRQPKQYFHVNMENEYPLHEKYDLHDVYATAYKVIVKATRQSREDEEINIDLPAFFVYHWENKHWLLIKGPTSKFYDDPWDADRGNRRTTDKQSLLVRRLGRILSGSLRGRWRTTITSARAAKLPWHDLL